MKTEIEQRRWIRNKLIKAGCHHRAFALGIVKDLVEVNQDHGITEARREAVTIISSWRSYTGPVNADDVAVVLFPASEPAPGKVVLRIEVEHDGSSVAVRAATEIAEWMDEKIWDMLHDTGQLTVHGDPEGDDELETFLQGLPISGSIRDEV